MTADRFRGTVTHTRWQRGLGLGRIEISDDVIVMSSIVGKRRSLTRPAIRRIIASRYSRIGFVMSSVFRFEFSDVLNRLGVVVGLVLLVAFTGLPLWILSMTVLATNSLVMPLGAIAVTLLYGDAVAKDLERQLGPSELTRKRSGHLDILSGRPPQASQISCHQNVQQFLSAEGAVVIMSHQKRTMEAAGCLFGVTMQPGVSTANDC